MFAAVSGSLECVPDLNAPRIQYCAHLSASRSASFYLANQRLPLAERCNGRSDMHSGTEMEETGSCFTPRPRFVLFPFAATLFFTV